jgi:hypothetical protein
VESQDNALDRGGQTTRGGGSTTRAVRLGAPETPPGFASLVPMTCDDKLSSVPTLEDDEELVDYNSSLERMNLDINVFHLFVDGSVPTEEDFAHLDFGPKDAIFQKSKGADNHLKALYMKGHINGKPSGWRCNC